jgi:hypothetical protein
VDEISAVASFANVAGNEIIDGCNTCRNFFFLNNDPAKNICKLLVTICWQQGTKVFFVSKCEFRIKNYENIMWETIGIVDICGVRKSERNILNKLSLNLSHLFITEFCGNSNGFYQLSIVYMRLKNGSIHCALTKTARIKSSCTG